MQSKIETATESSFEEILRRDGKLVYKTRGISMLPMLHENRDLVVIEPPTGRLKPGDVALYRRGSLFVLHRVLEVRQSDYVIRGDNTYVLETGITDADVLGVLTSFVRKGKRIDVTSPGYLRYVRFWNRIYPIRKWIVPKFRLLREYGAAAKRKLRKAFGKQK